MDRLHGQFGRLLGLLGGSRGLNRVPRILLVILVGLNGQNTLSGPSVGPFRGYVEVMLRLCLGYGKSVFRSQTKFSSENMCLIEKQRFTPTVPLHSRRKKGRSKLMNFRPNCYDPYTIKMWLGS